MQADKSKLVEIDLRRVKAKLTEQQVEVAHKRADAVTERLEEKKKEAEKKATEEKR